MELKQIAAILREDGLTATFVPKEVSEDENDPLDQVMIHFPTDRFDDNLRMQITRTNPKDDDNFAGLMQLQFFAGLPTEVPASSMDEVIRSLSVLNTVVPLMGFNVHKGEAIMYWRYVVLLPEDGDGVKKALQQTVWLGFFILETWGPALSALAEGDIKLDDILK
jgi:hypothetical protein